MSAQADDDRPTVLYRHFDRYGVLLYVGISCHWLGRTAGHESGSEWFDRVTTVTLERFMVRRTASKMEYRAINVERPIHNVLGKRHAFGIWEKSFADNFKVTVQDVYCLEAKDHKHTWTVSDHGRYRCASCRMLTMKLEQGTRQSRIQSRQHLLDKQPDGRHLSALDTPHTQPRSFENDRQD